MSLAPTQKLAAERASGSSGPRIPSATYRLQFGANFTFRDAIAIVPYLAELGVTDAYASPFLEARHSSTHGYDVINHNRIDPRIGTYDELRELSAALRERGMGLIVDVVPNHMGIGEGSNPWWMDVLEFGEASPYAQYFDIDWRPDVAGLGHRVLLPILEDQYGSVLEAGLLHVELSDEAFVLTYHDRTLPLAPCTYPRILEQALSELETLPDAGEDLAELSAIVAALRALPVHDDPDVERRMAAREWARDLKVRLAELLGRSADVSRSCRSAVSAIQGRAGEPSTFDALDGLLSGQPYRLASWRVAADEINYRRFFDINELAAIRVERPDVFADTHRLIFQMVKEGLVTGLRIDHPDGLLRPGEYFQRLQEAGAPEDASPDQRALYVVIEKIRAHDEVLDRRWPIYGTTGYDFLAEVNQLYVSRRSRGSLDRVYRAFTGQNASFNEVAVAMKKLIMLTSFAGEIQSLGRRLAEIAARNRHFRDFTFNSLTFALREIIASFSVYRTYIPEEGRPSPWDLAVIAEAVRAAELRNPRTATSVFAFVGETLSLQNLETFDETDQVGVRDFVERVQQVTGPVMAKGVEDTAFYIYNRLVSLNEVGADPNRFGESVAAFHRANADRASAWPHAMLATSTHDTKRSEDARARINVLTELAGEWRSAVQRWSVMNEPSRTQHQGAAQPDRNDEYLLYQTLAGVWPSDLADVPALADRASGYMQKAIREAKTHTSWIEPNERYEEATERFVREILAPDHPFVADIDEFVRRWLATPGYVNSLSQTLLKLTAPGVPDLYQGMELWDFSMVDPDNRRPVDFPLRRRLLAGLDGCTPDVLWAARDDGRLKLLLTQRVLRARNEHATLFSLGGYRALRVTGPRPSRMVAFAREHRGAWAVTVAARMVADDCRDGGLPIGSAWDGVRIELPDRAPRRWREAVFGANVETEVDGSRHALPAAAVLNAAPVALLIGEP